MSEYDLVYHVEAHLRHRTGYRMLNPKIFLWLAVLRMVNGKVTSVRNLKLIFLEFQSSILNFKNNLINFIFLWPHIILTFNNTLQSSTSEHMFSEEINVHYFVLNLQKILAANIIILQETKVTETDLHTYWP